MKTTIINWENAEENAIVKEAIEDKYSGDVQMFIEYNPEILKIDGVSVLFAAIESKASGERMVMYMDPLGAFRDEDGHNEIIKRLKQFYTEGDTFRMHYKSIKSTPESRRAQKNGIAYSRGTGIYHMLFEYKG